MAAGRCLASSVASYLSDDDCMAAMSSGWMDSNFLTKHSVFVPISAENVLSACASAAAFRSGLDRTPAAAIFRLLEGGNPL